MTGLSLMNLAVFVVIAQRLNRIAENGGGTVTDKLLGDSKISFRMFFKITLTSIAD